MWCIRQSIIIIWSMLTHMYKYTESKLICCYSHIYRRLMIFVAYPEIKCYDEDHPSQEKKTVRGFLVLLLLNYRYSTFSFVYQKRKKKRTKPHNNYGNIDYFVWYFNRPSIIFDSFTKIYIRFEQRLYNFDWWLISCLVS